MGIKIIRMTVGSWGHVKAFFDVRVEGFGVVRGFKLVQGKTDLFIGVPSVKKEDEYNNIVTLEDGAVSSILPEALALQAKGGLKTRPKQSATKVVANEDVDMPSDEDIPF